MYGPIEVYKKKAQQMKLEITKELAEELRERWILALNHLRKPLPLIVGVSCYEHFGNRCRIVEVNMYDRPDNAEVVIENDFGDRTQVEFNKLDWDTSRKIIDARCKYPIDQIVAFGISGQPALTNALADALRTLRDYQNGPPLPEYEKEWNEAMEKARIALEKVES